MKFEYTDCFYVSNSDLREMYLLCRDKGISPQKAAWSIAEGWDDCDFYAFGNVVDQVVKEITRRLEQAKNNV